MQRRKVGPELNGLFVARTIYDRSGDAVLVRQGTVLDENLIRAMMRRGIESVWVTNELLPDLEVNEVVTERTRVVTRRALENVLTAFDRREVAERQLQLLKESVRSLVDEIIGNQDVVVNVSHLRAWDDYTFDHSVQVAMLSILLGRELGLTPYQLYRLGTGAILHDIGKVAVPKEVLNKEGPLTPEEFELMKTHCRVGWDIIQDHPSIMPTSAIVILQHHERLDGSGYPSGLKDRDIHLYAKITAVADVFDAMRADRPYRRRLNPRAVVEALTRDAGPKLNADMVRILLRKVAVVPQGEIVRLTNGLIAVVTGNNPGFPLEPLVVAFGDAHNRPIPRQDLNLKASGVQVAEILDEWPKDLVRSIVPRPGGTEPPQR